jgi:1,4-dihydroxy-2-naphthoyl-CoA hydrolase
MPAELPTDPAERARLATEIQAGVLPGELGLVWESVEPGRVVGHFVVAQKHMAPLGVSPTRAGRADPGFVHAASVIALADSACGVGCGASLPPGAAHFTTAELKSNFLATAALGETVGCEARLVHGGRTTQVWDAEVVNRSRGRPMALFRCTQVLLYPKP